VSETSKSLGSCTSATMVKRGVRLDSISSPEPIARHSECLTLAHPAYHPGTVDPGRVQREQRGRERYKTSMHIKQNTKVLNVS